MDPLIHDTVGDILDQLKQPPKIVAQQQLSEVTKDNLEAFILKYTSELVQNSSDAVNTVNDYIRTAPNADDVSALAELIKATSSALDTLNKVLTTDKKNANAVKIKQMDIDSRKEELDTAIGAKLLMTREELMKQILDSAKVLDATIIPPAEDDVKELEYAASK